MGAPLTIFRLYRVSDGPSPRYVLAKAVRPDFPNSSQPVEDAAINEVERRLTATLANEVGQHAQRKTEVIATWESGFPEGDCFYKPTSGIDVLIWFALDAVHPGCFVFGVHADEASFWQYIDELSRDGEICPITDYARPAQHVQVRYVEFQEAGRQPQN